MWLYILKRSLGVVPVLLGITLLVFCLLHLIPGDPAVVLLGERATPEQVASLRQQLGLNAPLPLQYLAFLTRLVQFDLGQSIISGIPIIVELRNRVPATVELSVAATTVAIAIGMPLGILAAVRKNSWIDRLMMTGSLIGVSLPIYWLGLLLVYLFAVNLHWLPPSGRLSTNLEMNFQPITGFYVLDGLLRLDFTIFCDAIAHLILPALTLGTIPLAIIGRMTRSAMLEVLSQDYIRTAKAKGLSDRLVILRHALRNAMLPIVTVIGLQFGTLLGGAILTETIFSWNGIGSWVYDGILARDYPVVQGAVIVIASAFTIVNLLVDISYSFLDPRIRL
ncbi:ABC transporter permease [Tumidithrix helvetica PCC 7403]|uniref:ABC transporter permease n=1 Tax=Tumidithrix helvetica TaxID=3457545 RepID=UPI003CBAFD29